ncbi:hypothetical protein WJX77_006738 [Trebouxia sp. C0004]
MLYFEKPGLLKFKYQLQTQRDTSHWQFSSAMFQHYDTQYGPFQVDATSDNEGRNALCPESSPANSYTKHTWAGKSIWCNPPFDEVEEVLVQALAGAKMDPENTNTLLVLPDWPDAAWWPRLTRSDAFHRVGYYPTGSHLFTAAPRGQGQCRDMGPIRWGVIMAITGKKWGTGVHIP